MIGSSSTERALLQRLAQRQRAADLERERRQIDVVIGAVDQRHLEIDHREAGQHAGPEHGFEPLLDAGDVFLRHRSADDVVLELEASRRRQRLGHDLDLRELAGAAGLLLVRVVDGDRLA